jgi:hypothetical protein
MGLLKNLDEVKASAKMTVTVPQDFHKFVFQIKAFAHTTGFLFGKESILANQLNQFVKRVEWWHISIYKNPIANEENFAAKILLVS